MISISVLERNSWVYNEKRLDSEVFEELLHHPEYGRKGHYFVRHDCPRWLLRKLDRYILRELAEGPEGA